MRLGKLLEQRLQLSRKELKRTFARGIVRIDGQVEYCETRNVDSQLHRIEVSDKRLYTNEVYYLLNKPSGVVTANQDERHRTVFDCLKKEDQRGDLCFVGRLDRDTQGLLLLTSNGQLAYDLLQPMNKVVKVYEAYLKEPAENVDIERFAKGIRFLDGTLCKSAKLTILPDSPHHVLLEIHEGKFHRKRPITRYIENLQSHSTLEILFFIYNLLAQFLTMANKLLELLFLRKTLHLATSPKDR